jgi:hypothetical protein
MRRVTALLKRTRICLEFAARAGFGCFNFSRRQSAGCYCVPIFRDLLVHPTKHHPTNTGHKDEVIGSKDCRRAILWTNISIPVKQPKAVKII